MPRETLDPQAVLDFSWDWGQWLSTGEAISSFTVVATPADLVISSTQLGNGVNATGATVANAAVTAWLSGGTAGNSYTVTCHITTNDSRQDDRSRTISVRNR